MKNRYILPILVGVICILLAGVILGLFAYHFIPEKVEMSDPKIAPMLKAAEAFNRRTYGFSPLPEKADVRLEARPFGNEYDAMLHISSKTARTIAFRRIDNRYRWIGEQESFQGPKQYTTPDGIFFEQIVLTFNITKRYSFPTNKLHVMYLGRDPRLTSHRKHTLEYVQPILKEWGY